MEEQPKKAKDYIPLIKECISRSPTRRNACKRFAEISGKSEDAFRKVLYDEGFVKSGHSLRYAFSEEEEEGLVHTCLLYARQYTPLTIQGFINLASFFAEKPPGEKFSRHFATDFVRRHSDVLRMKKGKVTSARRCFESMQQNTIEFIDSINDFRLGNSMNFNNIVVFDETIIGDGEYIPVVIGEKRDSGGGNINALQTRERALGCYIPFSMPDGSTPFRVFIFKRDKTDKDDVPVTALEPLKEIGLREHPHRLFLVSEKGYLTTDLFAYIMKEFAKWWTTTRPGLHCYMISDNLHIHRNDEIVATALRSGIHMINIMPGSSHWFQVHDQLPFATLKKKMDKGKYDLLSDTSFSSEDRRMLLVGLFYEAESVAFSSRIVRKSFADVGLWPWNPRKILRMCESHSPAQKKEDVNDRLVDAIRRHRESLASRRSDVAGTMKPVTTIAIPTLPKKKGGRKRGNKKSDSQKPQPRVSAKKRKSTSISSEPPTKRSRRSTSKKKQ